MMKKSYLLHLLIFIISTFITFETSATGSNNSVNRATLQQIESSNSFKIDPPPKSIRVSQRNLRQANKVRRIQQGMPYGAARKILIQQGWQPNIPTSNGGIPNLENGQIKTAYDRGYKEIKDCSGTGLGLCRFEFTNSKRELLVVSATSQEELRVFGWFLDPPPKAIRVSRKNPKIATGMRRVQQGMPYGEARKILIQQGWQPNVPASNGGFPNLENSQIKTVYDRGYGEIKDCSGTGLGLCRFEFVNYKSELLVVSATSLPKLKVLHWFIEKSAE